MNKNLAISGAIGLSILIGYVWGIKSLKSDTVIKYIEGEQIRDTIKIFETSESVVPQDPILPIRYDTIYLSDVVYVAQSVDTAKIISEYIRLNSYNQILFDNDTVGKLSVSASVQYNKLHELSYSYLPRVQSIHTHARVPVLIPYFRLGLSTIGSASIGAGLIYKRYGFELIYDQSKDQHGIGISYIHRFK